MLILQFRPCRIDPSYKKNFCIAQINFGSDFLQIIQQVIIAIPYQVLKLYKISQKFILGELCNAYLQHCELIYLCRWARRGHVLLRQVLLQKRYLQTHFLAGFEISHK